jgi:CBS domain-containing protein
VGVSPDQSVDDAVRVMKAHDVKRVLVMEDKKLKGIISLGDLASRSLEGDLERDLSRSRPNN